MQRPAHWAALALCIGLAGCAAHVERGNSASSAQSLQIPASSASRIHLVVLPATSQIARSDDWQALRAAWRSAMAASAEAAGKQFNYLESEPQGALPPGTLVVVRVKDYRYLSAGARYGLGAFTGNAYVQADAAFLVGPGRHIAGTRHYSTTSSAWQGIFSAMTDKQLASITAQMVKDIDGS